MLSINAEKLKKIQEFIDLTKSSLTHDEFLSAFKQVIDYVKRIDERNQNEMKTMIENLNSLSQKLSSDIESKSTQIMDKTGSESLDYCKKEMDSMMKDHEEMMQACDDKMAEMKDGKDADVEECAVKASKLALDELKPLIPTIEAIEADLPKLGQPIRDALELLQGDERLDKSAIKGLDELISELRSQIGTRLGAVPGARLQNTCSGWVTPTGTLDGVNKTFTVTGSPLANTSEVQLNGQGYYDFTVSGSTYTLTDAPASTDLLKVRHWL